MGKVSKVLLVLLFGTLKGLAQQNPVMYVNFDKNTFLQIVGTVPDKVEIGGDSVIIFKKFHTEQGWFIQLTALVDDYPSTNMLVVCKDTLLQYDLVYRKELPQTLYTYEFRKRATEPVGAGGQPAAKDSVIGSGSLQVPITTFAKVKGLTRNSNTGTARENVVFLVDNIAVDSQYIYFKLRLRNSSQIDYQVEYMQFIVDARKRQSITNRAVVPSQSLYLTFIEDPNNAKVIRAKDQQVFLFALEKFALNEDEQLKIVLKERAENSRGRAIELKLRAAAFGNIIRL